MQPCRHKGEKGFTLIELLIVVVVLGILSATAIPNVTGFIDRGNIAAANAELSVVRTAGAAAATATGTITPYQATPSEPGDIGAYLSGTLKGSYRILEDGTVDFDSILTSYPGRTKDIANFRWQ